MRQQAPGWSVKAGFAVLLAWPAAASALPDPLCGRPEVLDEVARIVRGWDVYNTIIRHSVTETPTTRPNAVVCYATMETIAYEQTRAGVLSRTVLQTRRFDVQVDGNRFAVQVPR